MMASGCPSTSARCSSSSVSSIEWAPVAAATFTSFSTFQPRRLGLVGRHVEPAGHPGDVAHVQLHAARQVRVPVGAGGIPEVDVGVDDPGGLGHRTSSPTMLRSVPSSQSGTSGPPKVMLPPGRGWLRSPNHPAPTTSSAPASADRVGAAHQVGDELADRSARSALDADGERRDAIAGGPPAGARQLRRRLRPAATAGGRGVGERHEADRAVRGRRVVGHGSGPRGVGVDLVDDAGVLGEHALPAARRGGRRRGAAQRDDDGVERPGGSTVDASASAAPPKPAPPAPTGTVRARHAPGFEGGGQPGRCRSRSSKTMAHERTSAPDRSPAGASKIPGNRGLLPPLLAWSASAGTSAALTASSRRASDATPSVRTTSSSRGCVDHRHLGAAGEDHLAVAPGEAPRPRGGRRAARAPRAWASSRARGRRWPPIHASALGRGRARRSPSGSRRSATWR